MHHDLRDSVLAKERLDLIQLCGVALLEHRHHDLLRGGLVGLEFLLIILQMLRRLGIAADGAP